MYSIYRTLPIEYGTLAQFFSNKSKSEEAHILIRIKPPRVLISYLKIFAKKQVLAIKNRQKEQSINLKKTMIYPILGTAICVFFYIDKAKIMIEDSVNLDESQIDQT